MTREQLEDRIRTYLEAVQSMNTERFLAEYAADAILEDPVGAPAAKGHDQIRGVYDRLCKTFSHFQMKAEFLIAVPPEAMVKWSTTAETPTGLKVGFEGISQFKFGEDGKILQVRAYWDAKELARQFKS